MSNKRRVFMKNERRDQKLSFRMTEEQARLLREEMNLKNISSISKLIRTKIFETYTDEVEE